MQNTTTENFNQDQNVLESKLKDIKSNDNNETEDEKLRRQE